MLVRLDRGLSQPPSLVTGKTSVKVHATECVIQISNEAVIVTSVEHRGST